MSAAGELCLRAAVETDVDAVARIESIAFSDPWSRSAFASLLGQRHVLFLVADACAGATSRDAAGARGDLAGYVIAWLAADEAEIANVAVAPTLRGRGVGARLLDAALSEVALRGAAAVYLEVRESNEPARRLYASRGFEEVGRRRNYYRRPQEDALVLRRADVDGRTPTARDVRSTAVRSI